MIIIKWGILLFLTVVLPFVLGVVPIKYMNKFQSTPSMLYLCGCFVSFAVFEVVSIPFILLESSFRYLVLTYSIILFVIFIVSLMNIKNVIGKFSMPKKMPIWTYVLWVIFAAIIGIQIYMAIAYEHYDGDDAFYVAVSVVTNTFDDMYMRDCSTGINAGLDIRHALAPAPLYISWLSKLSGIHPATIAHSVISVNWLLLMYLVYGQIANCLLSKHRKFKPVLMIFISIWYMFGNISHYTSETFAMNRIWQGKGLLAAVIIPMLLLCMFYMYDVNVNKGIWILLTMVVITSVFATTVSVMIIPTMIGVSAFIIGIQQRSLKRFVQIVLTSLPCVVVGLIYVLYQIVQS